jgi:hypothetical protein
MEFPFPLGPAVRFGARRRLGGDEQTGRSVSFLEGVIDRREGKLQLKRVAGTTGTFFASGSGAVVRNFRMAATDADTKAEPSRSAQGDEP